MLPCCPIINQWSHGPVSAPATGVAVDLGAASPGRYLLTVRANPQATDVVHVQIVPIARKADAIAQGTKGEPLLGNGHPIHRVLDFAQGNDEWALVLAAESGATVSVWYSLSRIKED